MLFYFKVDTFGLGQKKPFNFFYVFNHAKIYFMKKFLHSLALFLTLLFLTNNHNLYAQCGNQGGEGNIDQPDLTCSQQGPFDGVGSGSSRYFGPLATVGGSFVDAYLASNGANISCATFGYWNGGNSGPHTNCLDTWGTSLAPGSADYIWVSTTRPNGNWTGNSAVLYYRFSTPSQPSISAGSTNLCTGGSASYSISGTSNTTFYNWTTSTQSGNATASLNSGGGNSLSANYTFSGSGIVRITAISSNNSKCSNSGFVDVTVNNDPTLPALSATDNGLICSGGTSTITASPSGGTGTFSYSWSNGAGNVASTSPSAGGAYTVTVTQSGFGCDTRTGSYTITVNSDPTISSFSVNNSGAICKGGSVTYTAQIAGGSNTTPTFVWSQPVLNGFSYSASGVNNNPNTLQVSVADNSTVTATNYNYSFTARQQSTQADCFVASGNISFALSNDPATPTATKSPTDATVCAGQTLTLINPAITVDGSGTCNFEYQFSTDNGVSWTSSNGANTWSTTVPSFNAVSGNNRIRIRRNCPNNGCTISGNSEYQWVVNPDPTLSSVVVQSAPDCNASNVAVLRATPTAGSGTGTPTFVWEWSADGSTNWSTVSAGTFTSTVTPNDITTPALTATRFYRARVSYAGAGCDLSPNVLANRAVVIPGVPTVQGNTSNFAASFCGGGTLNAIPGTNGTTCRFWLNSTSGTLLSSGTSYATNSNPLTQNPGTYTIVVESYNNPGSNPTQCRSSLTVTATVTITPAFSGSLSTSNFNGYGVSCSEGGTNNNGTVTATVTSTAYPVVFQWSTGTTQSISSGSTNSINTLTVGVYSVTVTDASGCAATYSTTLAAPPVLSTVINTTNFNGFGVSCNGNNNGTATAVPSGGPNSTYTYAWSTGSVSNVINNLVANTNYIVTVTDANGCTVSSNSTLIQPAVLSFTNVIGYVCSGSTYISANATLTASGGTGVYEYSINNGGSYQSSNAFTGISNGATLQLRVRDNNGCVSALQTVTVTFPANGTAVGDCNYIYVAADGGGNLGTKACPVASIVDAIAIYNGNNTRNHVLVLGGTYAALSAKVIVPAGITIDGGYVRSGDDWVKSTSAVSLITINPSAETATATPASLSVRHHIGIEPSGNNFILKDLNFSVLPAGASGTLNGRGTSVYGIYLNGRTGFTISRVVISTGAASGGISGSGIGGAGSAGGAGGGGAGGTTFSSDGGCGCNSNNGNGGGNGNGGAGAGGGGARCCGSGCNWYGCDAGGCTANNGGNGNPGASGSSFAPNNRPSASITANSYFVPVNGSQGGNGFGGAGGGGGGAGDDGTCCTCSCGGGGAENGGNGGSGGGGGLGGNFGYGGGSSIAIFAWGGSGTLTDSPLNPGTAATGGSGADGQLGAGGSGGGSGNSRGGCDGGRGGNGGSGGRGGDGGRGQDGANGISQGLVQANSASITVSGSSVPNNGTITANVIRGCVNSEITLIKSGSSGNWAVSSNPTLTSNLTQSSTSYSASDNTISVFYTSTGVKDLTVGSTTLRNFIHIYNTRTLPTITLTPSSGICPTTPINISTAASAARYEWQVANTASPTTIIYSFTSQSPGLVNPPSGNWLSGQTYQVRLRVFDECCGWSIPVYQQFTIDGVPGTATISGSASVCANRTGVTYSVPNITNTSTYDWNVSGITGATIASGDNTPSITVNFGAATSGNITLTPRNSCNVAGSQITFAVTVRALPVVSLSGTTALCISSPQTTITAGVSTPSGSPVTSYAWTPAGLISGSTTGNSINTNSLTLAGQNFAVLVTDGNSCTVSSNVSVTVDANTVAGAVNGGAAICSGSTSPLLTLSGHTGSIVRWESAVSPFSAWSPITNTNTLYTSGALTQTTQFRAVVKNGACATEFSTPTTVQVDQFTTANAGANQSQVCTPTYVLQGNVPVSGGGVWSVFQGNGNFSNSNANNATVSNMNAGTNIYTWTLDNGACASSSSNVTIVKKDSSYLPTQIFALPNSICPGDEVVLSLTGGSLGTNATWAWYSGSCGGTLVTNNASATVVPANDITYYLRAQGDCNVTSCLDAFVDVAIIPQISWTGRINSDWRNPGNWCGLIPTITSEVLIPAGTPNVPIVYNGVVGVAKSVRVLTGANVTVETGGKLCVNEACASAYAGADVTVCAGDSYQLNGSGEGIAPLTYSWTPSTYLSNPNIANPIAQNIPSIGSITYTFTVTDANGLSNTDQITITVTPQPSPALAGADFSVCSSNATLNASPIASGTGTWTLVSGSGTIASPNNPTTNISGLGFSPNVFRWTVTSGICPSDFDEITVTRDRIPVANAGTDINGACVSSAITLSNGASANFGTTAWTIVNGGGTLNNANTLAPTYNPVANDVNINPIVLRLTVTSNNTCSSVVPTATDDVNITIQRLPTANAGSNANICALGGSYTVNNASLTNGVPSWVATASSGIPAGTLTNANTLTPTYSAALADAGKTITLTLTVTSNNSCNPATAQSAMTMFIDLAPTANAGTGATICATDAHVFSSGDATAANFATLAWTASGNAGGTITGGNTLTPTYQSVAADAGKVITLTLTASGSGSCSAANATSQMTVTVQSSPVATLSPTSTTICAGAMHTISGASLQNGTVLWTVSGAGGVLSNANTLTPSYQTVSAEGGTTVVLTMTVSGSGSCSSQTDVETFNLNVTALPLANAGSNGSICATSSFTISGATASNNSSVSWTASVNAGGTLTGANTLTPTYQSVAADAGKTITLTLVAQGSGTCSAQSASSTMNISVQQLPVADAGSATAAMCGDGVQTFQVNDASSSFGNILWSIPSGTGNLFDQTTLTPTYTPDVSVIGSTVTLTMTVSGTGVCSAFSASDIKVVSVNAPATEPTSISGTSALCNGSNSVLTASGGSNGSGASFEWGTGAVVGSNVISGATASSYTTPNLNSTTSYWVRRISNSACTNITNGATTTVNVTPLPVADLTTSSASICAGTSYTMSGASLQNGTVLWTVSGGNGGTLTNSNTLTPSYQSVNAEGGSIITLTMTVTGSGPCSAVTDVETFSLSVAQRPTVNAGADATICASTTHALSASANNYNVGSVSWSLSPNASGSLSNQSGLTPTYQSVSSDGGKVIVLEISVDGTGDCSAVSVSDIMQITVQSLPSVNAGADANFCANSTYQVNDFSGTNFNNATIQWTVIGNASGSSLSNTTTSTPTYNSVLADAGNNITLSVLVNGTNTCSSFTAGDSKIISSDFRPVANAPADNTICVGASYVVSGAAAQYGSILWTVSGNASGTLSNATTLTPSYQSVTADAGKVITLTLTVTSNNSCNPSTASDGVDITVNALPTADAGPTSSTSICEGTSYVVSGASSSNGTVLWSVSGNASGTLSNNNTLSPTYLSVAADAGKTITLTLTVTSNNACSPQTSTDIIDITVDPLPVANAGSVSSTSICEGATFTVSGASASNGTVLWTVSGNAAGTLSNATTLTPSYQSVVADAGNTITLTMTVTSNNSCGTATDVKTVTITVAAKPTINAGTASNVCQGNNVPLNASGTNTSNISWSTSGDGSFSNTAILNPQYTHGTNDIGTSVTLTVSVNGTGACSSETASSNVSVTIYQNPTVSITGTAGPYVTTDPDVDLTTVLTITPSGGAFSGIGISGNSFSPSTSGVGTYTITYSYTDGNGCSDSETFTITVN